MSGKITDVWAFLKKPRPLTRGARRAQVQSARAREPIVRAMKAELWRERQANKAGGPAAVATAPEGNRACGGTESCTALNVSPRAWDSESPFRVTSDFERAAREQFSRQAEPVTMLFAHRVSRRWPVIAVSRSGPECDADDRTVTHMKVASGSELFPRMAVAGGQHGT